LTEVSVDDVWRQDLGHALSAFAEDMMGSPSNALALRVTKIGLLATSASLGV